MYLRSTREAVERGGILAGKLGTGARVQVNGGVSCERWSDGGGGDWRGDGSGLCGSGEWREVVVVVLLNRHRGVERYNFFPKCFSLRNIALDVDFLWKEERVHLLNSSLGPSSTPSYSPGPSTPPCYSSGPSIPQSYFPGPSRNAECSNCKLLLGKERVYLLTCSLGASSTLSYSPGPSTPPSYSIGPSTPQSYSSGPSRNAECSNCKLLLGKITVLKATVEMYMHPKQYTLTSAALLHEVYNDMRKLTYDYRSKDSLVLLQVFSWSSIDSKFFSRILHDLQHLKGILRDLQEMQSAQTASSCLVRKRLGKIDLDVDFFMERGMSPSTDQFSWSFIDSKLFSWKFNTSKLFSRTFNTSKLFFETFKKCRALKLQALA
nr:hypothetical protein [Tanacetum cinerariifolium]